VALKIIKAGMDSRQVLARFESERQALALMDHPNIAKVFDAGVSTSARPYFVMELVKGVPITNYSDDHRLTPKDRLALFVQVCHAVQHAHQKGIIHRDLKPTNVLVAPYDGRPVVKVIDFGVAKAAGQPLTEKTLVTGFGALVGTPEYMSPEQAELNNQDIDTRSDIYSLGVLLYELLTGTTPLTGKRVKEAALLEVLRLVREEEPPKPSTRLSQSKDSLPAISAQRHMEPAKLSRLVRGELDWIVMKALEKSRDRRYESASALAADVERYFADVPIQARPPSTWYRLRKFSARNKRGLVTATLLSTVVLVTGLFAYRTHRLEGARLEEQQQYADQLVGEKRRNALDKATLVAMSGDLEAAEKAIAEAELLGASAGQLRMLRGQVAYYRHEHLEAISHLEQAVRLLPNSVSARALLSSAYVMNLYRRKSAQVLRAMEQLTAVTPEDFLFKGLAQSFHDPQRGLKTLEDALRRPDATSTHSTVARSIRAGVYSRLASGTGDLAAAEQAVEHVSAVKAMMPGNSHALISSVYTHLVAAQLLGEGGHEERRRAVLAEAERDARALERHPTHPGAVFWRYQFLNYVGQHDAALAELARISEQTGHIGVITSYALELYKRGEYHRAAEFLERRKMEPTNTATIHVVRGLVLAELPNGPARALQAYKDATALGANLDGFAPEMLLLFLGRKTEALAAFQERRRQDVMPPPEGRYWILDYASGLITADEVLEAAGRSRARRNAAHFGIAFHLLADGDRAGARDHFRRCVASSFFMNMPHNWAKAILARMEHDPAWPPWIPMKE
jgi:serine/threonine protein kinase